MKDNDSILQNLMDKAKYYKINKNYKKAIDCFDMVLLIDPKDINVLNSKGIAYKNLKEF